MSLAARLRAALAGPGGLPPQEGDERHGEDGPLVAAAVLIAITDRPEPGIILTLRQATLRRHAGQFAFPGGRVDPGDRDTVAAALREADEEIGLDPSAVDVVGEGARYRTWSGYLIDPVVGVVPPDLPLVPHEAEVAEVFELPFAHAIDLARYGRGTSEVGGAHGYHVLEWGGRRIWGITAALLRNLARRLAPAP